MDEYKKKLDIEEREVADEVADEILTVKKEEHRGLFYLILLFLICLIFLVSSLSFAIFDTYYNGGSSNIIDIGTKNIIDYIIPDGNKKKDDKDKKDNKGTDNGSSSSTTDPDKKKDDSGKEKIDRGTVLFSFNEKSTSIYMTEVFPTEDEIGKKLSGDNEYFSFNISHALNSADTGKIVYEVSLIPLKGNTINQKNIRVYLTEDGNGVSTTKNVVNNFSDLPDSSFHDGAKVIYKKTTSKNEINEYVFRMWYSSAASLPKTSQQFACKVAVDAYYK